MVRLVLMMLSQPTNVANVSIKLPDVLYVFVPTETLNPWHSVKFWVKEAAGLTVRLVVTILSHPLTAAFCRVSINVPVEV